MKSYIQHVGVTKTYPDVRQMGQQCQRQLAGPELKVKVIGQGQMSIWGGNAVGLTSILARGSFSSFINVCTTLIVFTSRRASWTCDGCSCVEQSSNQCHYRYFPGFLQKTTKDISFH